MLPKQRVAWVEGMLMEPQHFQQQERFLENAFFSKIGMVNAYSWGVSSLEIDSGLLEQGLLAIKSAKGCFPDGTVFNMPGNDPLPPPMELNDSCQNKIVCMAILRDMPGNAYIDLTQGKRGSRYTVVADDIQDRNIIMDTTEGNVNSALIQLGQLKVRLCLLDAASQSEAILPVAMIGERTLDGKILLDNKYLPPMLDCRASGWIKNATSEVLGLISQRLSTVFRTDGYYASGGFSEVLEVMLLQSLGEYHLHLTHLLSRPVVHPEVLFQVLLRLLGRLCIIPGSESLIERTEISYNHDRPGSGYFQLFAALRRALSLVIESPAVALPFKDRGDNIYLCQNDAQLRLEKLVFAVSADMPLEQLRAYFPAQVKLGGVEKIIQLIDLQLPGARIIPMPAPPRHLPYYPDSVYFEVDGADNIYKEMMKGAAMALSIVGDFPGLRFDAWGLRQGRIR